MEDTGMYTSAVLELNGVTKRMVMKLTTHIFLLNLGLSFSFN